MPRRQTPFIAEHYYHIYNRGNNRQSIFFEKDNYLYLLRGIKKYLHPVVDTLAYCLMPTHYHLLVRIKNTPSSDLRGFQNLGGLQNEVSATVSKAMMRLSVSYTKAINKRFDRVGSLFQGAFRAKLIKYDSHLQNLCVYIHANPVKDGLVDSPADWPFSNYLDWLGERDGTLIDPDFIHQHFGTSEIYEVLVNDYVQTRILPEDVRMYIHKVEK